MLKYTKAPDGYTGIEDQNIACFNSAAEDNIDNVTVDSFGEEWSKFSDFDKDEINRIGDEYFDIVSDEIYGQEKKALDIGCGSGRWILYIAEKFGTIEGIDPSNAVFVAEQATKQMNHVRITKAGVDQIPFDNESFDFVFSLGVLHHIPDTGKALQKATQKLKKDGYFLLYLYYSLDNRGSVYKLIFQLSNSVRWIISKLPTPIKKLKCDLIALFIYCPLVFLASLLKKLGLSFWKKVPLSYYVGKSFFVVRNDALDRFGTPLEQRFSKIEIEEMMKKAGLTDIQFSNQAPFWHAIGKKA